MSDREDPNAVFDGEGSLSSGQFLRLIRQNAIENDKTTDDRWTAYYASSRMDGLALVWFEEQPEEVQESWKLLRRALMVIWPPSAQLEADGPAVASSIPTPAAAPPPPLVAPSAATNVQRGTPSKLGRMKLSDPQGKSLGYLSKLLNTGGACMLTENLEDAQVVQITPSHKPFDVKIHDDSAEQMTTILGWTASNAKNEGGPLAHISLPTATILEMRSSMLSKSYTKLYAVRWAFSVNQQMIPFSDETQGALRYLDIAVEDGGGDIFASPDLAAALIKYASWHAKKAIFTFEATE